MQTPWWTILLLAVACNSGGQTGDESAPEEPDASQPQDAGGAGGAAFFDAVRRGVGSADYEPADSVAELTQWSESIAVGTITEIRAVGGAPVQLAIVDVAVSTMLKGEPAETLHVMVSVMVEDAPRLAADARDRRVLVFLSPEIGDDGAAIVDDPEWPEDAVLHAPATPQGFVGEGEGGSTFESESLGLDLSRRPSTPRSTRCATRCRSAPTATLRASRDRSRPIPPMGGARTGCLSRTRTRELATRR